VSNLRSAALVQAFATVPRERFLAPGPWQIVAPGPPGTYRTSDDADPRHLYHNVVVAIDATRHLNNGQPGFLAVLLEALELQWGDHVVHIGCGLGYYTAIMAEVVGPAGAVTAIELDPTLAAQAGTNLRDWPQGGGTVGCIPHRCRGCIDEGCPSSGRCPLLPDIAQSF
jgi:protein-L-isoaspartate(D-aspartate) O-methyltransferase